MACFVVCGAGRKCDCANGTCFQEGLGATNVLRLQLLGELRISANGVIVALSRRAAFLLIALVLRGGKPTSRDLLADQLWPGQTTDSARVNLRVALSELRHRLAVPGEEGAAHDWIVADRERIGLDSARLWTDVAAFDALLRHAPEMHDDSTEATQRRESAILLYRGALLPDFSESWIASERDRLALEFAHLLNRQAAQCEAELTKRSDVRDVEHALETAVAACEADPDDVQNMARRMRLLARIGRADTALRLLTEYDLRRRQLYEMASDAALTQLANDLRSGKYTTVLPALPLPPLPPDIGMATVSPRTLADEDVFPPSEGALPLSSPLYIVRAIDQPFTHALLQGDSVVLVHGPRLVGKTSLLARSLHEVRQAGNRRVVLTDFSAFEREQMADLHQLAKAVAV